MNQDQVLLYIYMNIYLSFSVPKVYEGTTEEAFIQTQNVPYMSYFQNNYQIFSVREVQRKLFYAFFSLCGISVIKLRHRKMGIMSYARKQQRSMRAFASMQSYQKIRCMLLKSVDFH